MWSAVSGSGIFLLLRRHEMKRADRHSGYEDASFLRTKLRSEVKSYTAAVVDLSLAGIIIVNFQHVIRFLSMLRYRNTDMFWQPFS